MSLAVDVQKQLGAFRLDVRSILHASHSRACADAACASVTAEKSNPSAQNIFPKWSKKAPRSVFSAGLPLIRVPENASGDGEDSVYFAD